MRKGLLLVVILVMVSLCSSSALASSPMGPPTAGLNKGQFRAGVDYSYGRMDIKMNQGSSPGGGPSLTMNNVKHHYVLANLGYGIRDDWEVSLRVGGGAARDSDPGGMSFRTASPVPGNGIVAGFGTKATFIRQPDIEWGGLFQLLWTDADAKAIAGGNTYRAGIRLWEIQLAAGPTYKLNEKVSLYGGPFLHLVSGRFVANQIAGTGRIRYKLDEGSIFGGYIGTEIKVTSNADFRIEYQHTAAADALGMSLLFKLN